MSQPGSAEAQQHVLPTETGGETVEEAHDHGKLILQEIYDARPQLKEDATDVDIASHISDYTYFVLGKFSDEVVKEWKKNLLEGSLENVPVDTIAQKLSFYETLTTELLYEMQYFIEDDGSSLLNSIKRILAIKKKKLEETVSAATIAASTAAQALSASKDETRVAKAENATLDTAKKEQERINSVLKADIDRLNADLARLTADLNAAATNLLSIRGSTRTATASRVQTGTRARTTIEGGGLRTTHRKRTKIIL